MVITASLVLVSQLASLVTMVITASLVLASQLASQLA